MADPGVDETQVWHGQQEGAAKQVDESDGSGNWPLQAMTPSQVIW